jgi:hypothetical protein
LIGRRLYSAAVAASRERKEGVRGTSEREVLVDLVMR